MSSPAIPSTNIEDLPPEIISVLFHLVFDANNLKDLVACSLVNKRWHSIYSTFKVQRLAAIDEDVRDPFNSFAIYYLANWYHSEERIREEEICSLKMCARLIDRPFLSNLKHLALSAYLFDFPLDELNRFGQLVHLEIHMRFFCGPSCVQDGQAIVHLNLPQLKVLVFSCFNPVYLYIDCAQLNVLASGHLDRLQVKHPETIRKLEIERFDPRWLAQFQNVECLVLSGNTNFDFGQEHKIGLQSLPKLKEFYFNVSISRHFRFSSWMSSPIGTLAIVKRALCEFMEDNSLLKGADSRFVFAGFPLTRKRLDTIDFGMQVIEREERRGEQKEMMYDEYIYAKNWQLVDPNATLDFITTMDYSRLMSGTEELLTGFFRKFPRIQIVRLTGEVPNESHLLWFLKSLRLLKRLEFDGSQFGQEFYDQLPDVTRSLVEFKMKFDSVREDGQPLNYEFIGKWSRLVNLALYRDLNVEALASALRNLRNLGKMDYLFIGFIIKGKRCSISQRRDSKELEFLALAYLKSFRTENLDEILNQFEILYKIDQASG